jgi:phenylalanyl-tRNA synthetase beta chain
MQERLIAAGFRPINVIVDITNYVMLEYGQPLHAFDYDKIRGQKIVVRRAKGGETFVTLDGQERTLDLSLLMICDGEGPVAVAGIMGGQNSEISETTTTVLLESACFDAIGVRAGAKKLGMSTDSSYRFERGVDPSGTVRAANRAAQLLQELAGAEVAPGVVDEYVRVIEPREIEYRPERGNRLIGAEIPADEQRRYLESLGLQIEMRDGRFVVTVPTSRPDLVQEDDVAEEVGRIYGFDKIPYRLPGGSFFGRLSDTQQFVNRVRHLLRGSGLQETLTHSLSSRDRLERFNPAPSVRLQNPLSEELAELRTALAPMLADLAERNARHGLKDINIFEVGLVFAPKPSGEAGAEERFHAAGLLCGSRLTGRWNVGKDLPLQADFFAAKGVLEELFRELRVSDAEYAATAAPGLHPGRAAKIAIRGKEAGILGQIHPRLQEELELPGPAYLFELDLEVVRRNVRAPEAKPIPRFPGVSRDLAVVVARTVEAGAVRNLLVKAAGPFLEAATVFDVYEGKGVPEGHKSLALSLQFRSLERTMTDSEVDEAVEAIRAALAEQVGAAAR